MPVQLPGGAADLAGKGARAAADGIDEGAQMTRPKAAELRFTGINRDQIPGLVPADWWTDGRNVYFKAGKTVRTPGEAPFAASGRLFDAQFVHYVDVGPQSYWVYGGDAGIAVTDGTTHWNITPTVPGWGPIVSQNLKYSVGDLAGVVFVNHPDRQPFWWDADVTHRMTVLPGWPAGWSADVMRAHKNFLFAASIDTGAGLIENQVSWSSSADPGQIPSQWTPSPTNDAGDYTVGGPSGPVLDMLSIRDQLLVAKSAFMATLQYVGGQYIFEGHDVFPSTGLFATGAWIELGGEIYMITGNGKFIRTDLSGWTDLLYGVLEDYFRAQLNWQYPGSCFAWRDSMSGQACFAYPVGTSKACMEAITIEIGSDRPGIRDVPGVYSVGTGSTGIVATQWDPDSQAWDADLTTWNEGASGYKPSKVVFAAGSSGLLEQGAAATQVVGGVATPMNAFAARKGLDGGDLEYRKYFAAAQMRVQGQSGDVIKLQFSVRDTDDAVETFTPLLPYVIGSGTQLDMDIDGRLAGMQAQSLGGSPWQLSSVVPQGRRSGRW